MTEVHSTPTTAEQIPNFLNLSIYFLYTFNFTHILPYSRSNTILLISNKDTIVKINLDLTKNNVKCIIIYLDTVNGYIMSLMENMQV